MDEIKFTIPLPPRTKKNSSRIVQRGGRHILLPSKAFLDYQDKAGYFIPHRFEKISSPVQVTALFYMDADRVSDLVGHEQAIDDILVHYGVLADDNRKIIVSHDGSRVLVDRKNPRTEVTIKFLEE